MIEPAEITDEMMREALHRLGMTPDGELFYRWLQKELMGVMATENLSALQTHNGRRTLARDLMGLLAKGIEERGRTESNHNAGASSRPVVFAVARSVAVARPRGAGRRGGPYDDPEPGT